jgi:hypothetical protein
MSRDEVLGAWIGKTLGVKGKTQKALAEFLNLDRAVVNRIVAGRRPVKLAELSLIENFLGETAPREAAGFSDPPRASTSDYVSVPFYALRTSLEPGQDIRDGVPLRHMLIDRAWLSPHVSSPANVIGIDDRGEQMLVDLGGCTPLQDSIVIVRIHGALFKRTVSVHPARGTITMSSDDPLIATYSDLTADEIDAIGRVVWVAKFIA